MTSPYFGFTDFTDFSLIKSFFWGDDKKDKKKEEEKHKITKNKPKTKPEIDKKSGIPRKLTYTHDIYTLSQTKKKLILKLEEAIDNYLYRIKVKNLILKLKDYYMIVCTANIPNLYLNIIGVKKKVKQYKFSFNEILKQNVAFIPRKVYRNKKKLKFIIANIKKEIFMEPRYQTEYEDGSFVNVLDLQDIKEKEYKNEEDFQNFLKTYYKNKKEKNNKIDKEDYKKLVVNGKKDEKFISNENKNNGKEKNINKIDDNINKIEEDENKNKDKKDDNIIKVNKKNKDEDNKDKIEDKNNKIEDKNNKIEDKNNKIEDNIKPISNILKNKKGSKHRRLKSCEINDNIDKNKITNSLLKNNNNSSLGINSILKERKSSQKRLKNGRKISFGGVQFSY